MTPASRRTLMLTCWKCGKRKPWTSEFFPQYGQDKQPRRYCKACNYKGIQQWGEANPIKCKSHRANYRRRLRLEALSYYSQASHPYCACCGERELKFLGIDHMKGFGQKHRDSLDNNARSGTKIYRWLHKNKFPKGFQVLCHNCNMAKGFYGACPHKESEIQ